ncbi:MAG: CPBP family intramembrane glutamic endopeptidase [Planctomycetota bacterium]
MKFKGLIAYLIIVTLLSAGFIVSMRMLGQKGFFLAGFYMLVPAIAAIITRLFFYENKFRDANLRFGKVNHYLKFWLVSLGITILFFAAYTVFGAIKWDFSGNTFLDLLAQQMAAGGKSINDLPKGFTPYTMLLLYSIGGLTVFNILPGIIAGFGEEFGWRGFMFPELYKIKPWAGFVIGGLIWFAWHVPLLFVFPQTADLVSCQQAVNFVVTAAGSICTFVFLSYVYVKTENIFVASIAHITMNNAGRSFSYFVVITNQMMANIAMMVAMMIVVAVLYYSGELKVFETYFKPRIDADAHG